MRRPARVDRSETDGKAIAMTARHQRPTQRKEIEPLATCATTAGAQVGTTLRRIVLDGERVVEPEEVASVEALGERIRAVAQSPEGWIVMLADSGKLLRLRS
jgi:glucose/arabinose dehydrogenase